MGSVGKSIRRMLLDYGPSYEEAETSHMSTCHYHTISKHGKTLPKAFCTTIIYKTGFEHSTTPSIVTFSIMCSTAATRLHYISTRRTAGGESGSNPSMYVCRSAKRMG